MSHISESVIVAAIPRSANFSAELPQLGAVGVMLDCNLSAITGTSVTLTLEAYDPVGAAWYSVLASAAKSSTGRFLLYIHPVAAVTSNVSAAVPARKRMRVTTTGTWSAATLSVIATSILD